MTMKFSVVSFLWKLSACDIQENTQITVPICPAAMTMTSRIMSDAQSIAVDERMCNKTKGLHARLMVGSQGAQHFRRSKCLQQTTLNVGRQIHHCEFGMIFSTGHSILMRLNFASHFANQVANKRNKQINVIFKYFHKLK